MWFSVVLMLQEIVYKKGIENLLVFVFNVFEIVGVAGFELATPCSQSRCANRTALHPVFAVQS